MNCWKFNRVFRAFVRKLELGVALGTRPLQGTIRRRAKSCRSDDEDDCRPFLGDTIPEYSMDALKNDGISRIAVAVVLAVQKKNWKKDDSTVRCPTFFMIS